MPIDQSKIATDAAKAAALRHPGKRPYKSSPFDGRTFQREYLTHGGNVLLLSRAIREHEIETSDPAEKLWLAYHHMEQAQAVMQRRMLTELKSKERFSPEPKEWCNLIAQWPELACDRLDPAFKALEDINCDPDGQYRREYAAIMTKFNEALCGIDRKTAHLSGTAKWKQRWAEYQSEIMEFFYDDWEEFIGKMMLFTSAHDQNLRL